MSTDQVAARALPTGSQMIALALQQAIWGLDLLDRMREACDCSTNDEWDASQALEVARDMVTQVQASGVSTYEEFDIPWSKMVSMVRLASGATQETGPYKNSLDAFVRACIAAGNMVNFAECMETGKRY